MLAGRGGIGSFNRNPNGLPAKGVEVATRRCQRIIARKVSSRVRSDNASERVDDAFQFRLVDPEVEVEVRVMRRFTSTGSVRQAKRH